MAYNSGYEKAFPYFVSASDFAESVVTGTAKYESLNSHIKERKKLLPNLVTDSYTDWVDREIIRFNRLKEVKQ